jgi:choline dehydrogenase-like flavoprotein
MTTSLTDNQRETLAALVDTYVAAVPRDDDPHGFFATSGTAAGAHQAVEHYLARKVPAEQRAGMLGLLDALAGLGLKDQPLSVRVASLRVVAGIAPETSIGVDALRQLSVMMAYGVTDEAGRNPLWSGMQYPGPRASPPRSDKPIHPVIPEQDTLIEADAVVVGSGAGGGVIAGELAQAGRHVVVLEAGGYFDESDFTQRELWALENLYLRGGILPTADRMVNLVAGGVLGGGTTVNWSNSVRPRADIRKRWASEFGLVDVDTDAFDTHVDAVLSRIKANAGVADQNGPHQRLAEGAARLGFHYRRALLNIDPERYDPDLAGYSGFGDVTGAKQGTLKTFLQDAVDAGAQVLVHTRADRIIVQDGRTAGVEATYTDPASGRTTRVVVRAPQVVVAGGSLETPALLLRSGIGGPAVGRNLRLHPSAMASGFYAEPQDPWRGPAQAGILDEFASVDDGFGFIVEGVNHSPATVASALPWRGPAAHKELMRRFRHRADLVAIVQDDGTGRVTIDQAGEAVHWYPFTDERDRRHFYDGIETVVRIHHAAGAEQILVNSQRVEPWHRGESLDAFLADIRATPIGLGGIPAASAHQMCSARMGTDPATSVASPTGELHDTHGVWIGDTSAFPTCSGVNPMVTCMALARRTAHHILATTAGQVVR